MFICINMLFYNSSTSDSILIAHGMAKLHKLAAICMSYNVNMIFPLFYELQSPKKDKAQLISRMAKMGTATLPFQGAVAAHISSDSESEVMNALCFCYFFPPLFSPADTYQA